MNVPVDMNAAMPSRRTLAEAEDWFARRLTHVVNVSEREAFERWHADPQHAAAYAQTERLWQGIGGLAGQAELEALSAEALRATDPRRRAPRPRWALPLAWAAGVAMCAVLLTLWLGVLRPSVPPVVYVTGPDQRETVTLADGSQLRLNGDTAVAVRLQRRARVLTLERGEAVFEVAHDANRPFRVQAGDGEVTALGTRFQVRQQAAQVTVTLLEGSVQLARPGAGAPARLVPGDQATYGDARSRLTMRKVDPEVVSSWTRGRLLFRGTPLAEAVAEVNRYARPQLQLADPALGALPISGTFPMHDSESVALALQALLPVRIEYEANGAIVLHRQ